ncbi:MAG: hypothetical protein K2N30_03350 [Clostridia bacterium]|nr:hypothetical protein [Clostridia bacterium]
MSNRKITAFLVVALLSVFMLLVCLFYSQTAFIASADSGTAEITAENAEIEPTTPETDANGSLNESGAESISDSVKAYLQSIYGADYEKYYNQIVEHWGSVEKFLLNASENLPEEYRYKATELLSTINAYISVGADAVLLLCVGIYIIYRAKKNKKINADLTTLKAGDNQIETAQLALIQSQKAQSAALQKLLPGEKFEDAVNELAESDKALDSAAEEVQKIV